MKDNIIIQTPSGESYVTRQWIIDNIKEFQKNSKEFGNQYFINYKETNTTFSINKNDWNETLIIIRNQKINQILNTII
jgi:hypothetical protein